MNDLERVLLQKGEEKTKQQEAIVEDVKLLLASDAQEERNILKAMGLDNDIRYVETKQADIITKTKNKDRYGRPILSFDEIKQFCIDYRLYMRPANKFKGVIPKDLGAELVRFCKEKEIVIPAHSNNSDFFVIAPPRMFEGYQNAGQVLLAAFDVATANAKERKRLRDLDPILVYKLNTPNGYYYAIIKSWGEDFTPLRRLYGFLTTKAMLNVLTFVVGLGVILTLGLIALYLTNQLLSWHELNDDPKSDGTEIASQFGIVVVWVAAIIISVFYLVSDWCRDARKHIRHAVRTSNWWSSGC